ncbi:MAG: hypothetical protein RLZZ77_656 [Bacteroidota bacterium]|jgi:hypothetical protein
MHNKFHLPSPQHKWIWLFIALVFKAVWFIYKVNIEDSPFTNHFYPDTFAQESDDSFSYFEPVDHLINQGSYDGEVYKDFRMPGYGLPYFLLRLFFSQTTSLNLLVVLQLLFSAITVYYFAALSRNLFKTERSFYWAFFLYCASTFVSIFDHVLLTETFCTGALIMSVYFFTKEKRNNTALLLSGLWLTWAIFLRPVCLPLLAIGIFVLFVQKEPKFLKKSLLFVSAFLIFESCWIGYNANKHHQFIPLTSTVYYPEAHNSYQRQLFHFVEATGGSIIWWEPGADVSYYIPTPSFITKKREVKLPQHAYTSQFNGDSLLLVKKDIAIVLDSTQSDFKRDSAEKVAQERLERYTASIKNERPFLFYIGSRIRLCKSFLIHSGTYNLFVKSSDYLSPGQFIIKVFYSLFYLTVILLGLCGTTFLLIRKKENWAGLFPALTGLFLTFIFPVGLQLDEFRYLVPAYPFLLLGVIAVIEWTFFKIRGHKSTEDFE